MLRLGGPAGGAGINVKIQNSPEDKTKYKVKFRDSNSSKMEFNCDFNAPMYVDFENLDGGDGNADEFFGKSFFVSLTLSLPRGGEISPPPTKIESYSFKNVLFFFNF